MQAIATSDVSTLMFATAAMLSVVLGFWKEFNKTSRPLNPSDSTKRMAEAYRRQASTFWKLCRVELIILVLNFGALSYFVIEPRPLSSASVAVILLLVLGIGTQTALIAVKAFLWRLGRWDTE